MEWLPPGWCPRVVAFDIDGTLTDENKRLDMHAVEALRRLEDAGIPVILATGDVRAITYGLWRFIGLSGPMCCENGGVLWHPVGMNPWFEHLGMKQRKLLNGFNPSILKSMQEVFEPTLGEKANGVCSKMKIFNWSHHPLAKATGPILTLFEPVSRFT